MSKLREIGDFIDNALNDGAELFEAPVLEGEPQNNIWYRIMIPEGKNRRRQRVSYLYKKSCLRQPMHIPFRRRSSMERIYGGPPDKRRSGGFGAAQLLLE